MSLRGIVEKLGSSSFSSLDIVSIFSARNVSVSAYVLFYFFKLPTWNNFICRIVWEDEIEQMEIKENYI